MSHIICGRFLIKVGLIAIYNCSVILNEPKQFNEQSYDAHHVTIAHCTKNFCTKNLENFEKIMNIQAYSKTFQHFLGQ